MKKHRVELTKEQRQQLEQLTHSGRSPARQVMHAQVLLKADSSPDGPDWSDQQIQEAFGVGESTIWRIRRRFREDGLEDALHRHPQPERPEKRKINGELEAHLIAISCSPAPQGYQRWSVRLLADAFVELAEEEGSDAQPVSRETIRRALKKMNSSPG